MKPNLHLLVIDPQNDFCDLPHGRPALPVPGAHADMLRLAQLVDAGRHGIADITVTLDAHHRLDIAHPTFWTDAEGREVAPFTEITAAAVRMGRYRPRDDSAAARTLAYLDALEAAGRYRLMVWPVHCEIGSWGQQVHADLSAALRRWEAAAGRAVHDVVKGANPWTEHYSAVMAEVPLDDDPATQANHAFVARLRRAERVFVAGEAGSHCVKATVEHLAAQFGPQDVAKLVLVTDCMSPVAGFEAQYDAFVRGMLARGAQAATTADVLAELRANTGL